MPKSSPSMSTDLTMLVIGAVFIYSSACTRQEPVRGDKKNPAQDSSDGNDDDNGQDSGNDQDGDGQGNGNDQNGDDVDDDTPDDGDGTGKVPPVGNLNPGKAPGENFDLSAWKLTLPIDENGDLSGTAEEIKPIPADYVHEQYFYTAPDGGMVFKTPANGARTSANTKYPRTELRELDASGDDIEWTTAQGGTLSATLAVNALPDADGGGKGRIIVGQIHGPDDELCRLYYDNGNLYFNDDKAGDEEKETSFQLEANGKKPNIPLNEKFSYEIKVDAASNKMTVSVTDKAGTVYSAVDPISGFWDGKALYFKAGNYLQVSNHPDAGTTGSGTGAVTFYALPKPSH